MSDKLASRSEIFEWIYKWCGSAYCMCSDTYPRGECACDEDCNLVVTFDTTHMHECAEKLCPILKSFEKQFAHTEKKQV